MVRIALIHALRPSIDPIEAAFDRHWPEAVRTNLLDDGLSTDRARDGRLTDAMIARFLSIGNYARMSAADAILFTCSAFGPAIDEVARELAPMIVMKPTTAVIDQAQAIGGRIGLVASFAPTLQSLTGEFPAGIEVATVHAAGALEALAAGDSLRHDALAASAAATLGPCSAIVLAQFSLARAAPAVARATGIPVLTTPDCAVQELRRRLR